MPAAWRLTAWRAVGSCCSRAERERLAITASRKGGSGRGSGGVGSNLPNGIGPRPVTSGVAARLPGPNSHAGTRHQSGNGLLHPPPDPSVEHFCYTPVPGRSPSASAEYGIPKELLPSPQGTMVKSRFLAVLRPRSGVTDLRWSSGRGAELGAVALGRTSWHDSKV